MAGALAIGPRWRVQRGKTPPVSKGRIFTRSTRRAHPENLHATGTGRGTW